MVEKIMLSDKDYEYLTKGIASGVGIGTIIGMLLQDIILGFAAGGVIGLYILIIEKQSHIKNKVAEID